MAFRHKRDALNAALALIVFLATVSLSSCAGYTTNASSNSGSGAGGSGGGVLSSSPTSVSFGNVAVGSTATQNVKITNTGTGAVNISGASISGTGFTVVSGSGSASLAVGDSATVEVQFAPTSTTPASGTLTVNSDASDATLAVGLTGTGLQAQISTSTTNVNFGLVAMGNTDSQSILLKNNGNETLTFSGISVSGSSAGFNYSGLNTSTTIAAGGSVTFDATFDPSSTSAASGSITLTTNGSPSSLVIDLSGTGQASTPSLSANPTTLPFGNVLDQSSQQLTTLVTNNGNANVTISGVTVAGAGFSASGVANGTVLTPGQSVTLTVTFAPTSGGSVSGASVSIASNAANSPLNVGLSGTGMHSVVLSWDASPTNGVTYNVFRGTSSGAEGTTPINPSPVYSLSYTDTNVTPGTDYYYYVEAVDSGGSSTPSNEAPADVPNP